MARGGTRGSKVTLLKATITGNLRAGMEQEVRRVAGALRRAVATTGQQAQAELRAQARGAGFRDGGRAIANAWRLNVYPRPGTGRDSFKPAAQITSRMAEVVDVFDRGRVITAKGRKHLAIPTPVNRVGNRRSKNGAFPTRVTPQEMFRLGGFIRPTSTPGLSLWCLPLRTEKTKRGRLKLFAGRYTQVLTGNRKGAQAIRAAYARDRSFVPMFFLMRQVSLRKRLSVEQVRARAPGLFANNAVRELGRA
jgi:hypothetical protein